MPTAPITTVAYYCLYIAIPRTEQFRGSECQTLYIDDIDGGEAAGTVRFGLDGVGYEIDLSAEHTKELHTALGKYIDHARKAGGTSRRAPRSRAASAIDTTAVRTWAREQGIDIKDRGRVPAASSPNTRRPPGGKHPPAGAFPETLRRIRLPPGRG